jgi:hypothetical protein
MVVEILEVVEIHHDGRDRCAAPFGIRRQPLEHFFQKAAIVETGQRVAQGLVAQPFAERDIGQGQRHGIGQRNHDGLDALAGL